MKVVVEKGTELMLKHVRIGKTLRWRVLVLLNVGN
jgi:hypothetical protein